MMTPRENVLEVINGGNPEYVPLQTDCNPFLVSASGAIEEPWEGGVDAFGVNWLVTKEGAMPEPNNFRFDDVSEWRKHVQIPDVNSFDFNAMAEMDLATIDRSRQLVNVLYSCGLFERLVSFMGFENTLCALITDPDSCKDFFNEMSTFKAKVIDKIIDAYKPDVITYSDDMAHAKGLFMSPETYREVIKPYHRRIADAITSRGVIFSQHICGKCEDLLEDFVGMGCRIWNSAQIMNDLAGIQKKYKGILTIEGGWDSSGPAAFVDASMDTIISEANRCIDEYGVNKGFICWPVVMNEKGNGAMIGDERLDKLISLWSQISKIY